MQNDLISRSALLELVQFRLPIDNHNAEVIAGCVDITRRIIENAPTVDAVEVDKAMAWLEGYTVTDTEQIYSNGTVYVPLFRVEQAFVDKAYNGLREG